MHMCSASNAQPRHDNVECPSSCLFAGQQQVYGQHPKVYHFSLNWFQDSTWRTGICSQSLHRLRLPCISPCLPAAKPLPTASLPSSTPTCKAVQSWSLPRCLQDGSKLTGIDAVIYCTGYQYSYPWLEGSGLLRTDQMRVHPLYQHIFPPDTAPTLAFIGLLWKSLRNPQFEYQVSAA